MSTTYPIFITGTGTDVGKTIVTTALLRAFAQQGHHIAGLKPVQTGCTYSPHGELLAPDVELYKTVCPSAYHEACLCFEPACSPHLAAQMAGTTISAYDMVHHLHTVMENLPAKSVVCIEGSGGAMVPLNTSETFLDIMRMVKAPVIIAAANELGTINHTLLTIHSLRSAQIPLLGFVLTTPHKPSSLILEQDMRLDNRRMIETMANLPCLGEIPWLSHLNDEDATHRETAWECAAHCLAPALKLTRHWFAPHSQKSHTHNLHAP